MSGSKNELLRRIAQALDISASTFIEASQRRSDPPYEAAQASENENLVLLRYFNQIEDMEKRKQLIEIARQFTLTE